MQAVVSGIDVDAAHDVVTRVEDGEREPRVSEEVSGVLLEIRAVLGEAHLAGPAVGRAEAWGTPDVVDARRPRGVVALVVLGPQRLEAKLAHAEPGRRVEPGRGERAL